MSNWAQDLDLLGVEGLLLGVHCQPYYITSLLYRD